MVAMVASTRLTLVEATEAEEFAPPSEATLTTRTDWCCGRPPVLDPRTTETYCATCGLVLEPPRVLAEATRANAIGVHVGDANAHTNHTLTRELAHLAVVDSHERQRDLAEDPRTTRQRDGNRERIGLPGSAATDIEAVTTLARRERLLRSQDIPTQEVAVTWNVTRVHAGRGEAWAVQRFQVVRVHVGGVTRTVSPLDRLCVRLGVDRRVAKRLAYALMRARVAERALNVGGGGR
jgi:hypothetical protein